MPSKLDFSIKVSYPLSRYKDAGIRKVGRAGITYLTGWFSGKYRDPKYIPFLLKVTDEVSKMRISGEAAEIASKHGFIMD